MAALIKVMQIDDTPLRDSIIDAIRRLTEDLECDYEISILRGSGNKDWDLVVKAPNCREICRILYEGRGDLDSEVFERHLQQLMRQLCCLKSASISRDILGE